MAIFVHHKDLGDAKAKQAGFCKSEDAETGGCSDKFSFVLLHLQKVIHAHKNR
jgi:hypothetical protein